MHDSLCKINKVAFVIPIHPKHYDIIYNFINKMHENGKKIDIFLVFSSYKDYKNFEKKDKILKIILNKSYKEEGIITYKKFYALEQLRNNSEYEYFIVCDAEISIIPENFNEGNILQKIEKIFENKTIYAGRSKCSFFDKITTDSANLFDEQEKLKNITNNFTLYYWWSDLPMYKREHLTHFFGKIDYSNIDWFQFDHVVYLNYLILYHKFDILNTTPLLNHEHSLESYHTQDEKMLDVLKENKYGFSWATPKLFHANKEYFLKEGTFLLYHLDRN
jgi:hypothetical protein